MPSSWAISSRANRISLVTDRKFSLLINQIGVLGDEVR